MHRYTSHILFVFFYISDGKYLRIPSLIKRCHAPGPFLLSVNNSVGSCVWRKLAILKRWQSSKQTLLTPKILQMLSTYYWTWCHDLRKRQTTSKTTKLTFFLRFLAVQPNMIVFFYQLYAQILYFNTFITFLYMFRPLLCSSSGGQLY